MRFFLRCTRRLSKGVPADNVFDFMDTLPRKLRSVVPLNWKPL